MFIIIAEYIRPIEEIDAALPEHYEFLDRYYALNKFICSGRRNPRNGGIIICNAENRSEIDEILREDIFFRKKLVRYDIFEFIPTKYAKGLENFVS